MLKETSQIVVPATKLGWIRKTGIPWNQENLQRVQEIFFPKNYPSKSLERPRGEVKPETERSIYSNGRHREYVPINSVPCG